MIKPLALAQRTQRIEPFHVMEVMKRAALLATEGRSIIHMTIGEPDFGAAPAVLEALAAAMAQGKSQYTPALGIAALREEIAGFYRDRYGLIVSPAQVVITAGASGALLLTMAALVDAGQEILMPDPSYPCNRHFVTAFEGRPRLLPAGPAERFQLSASVVEHHWGPDTRGVLVASPSNPTGTSIDFAEMGRMVDAVRVRGGVMIVDEIYHALTYDGQPRSAVEFLAGGAEDVIVLNSFSKYFGMTGWRLGWMVAPPSLVPTLEKLAQNLFICASSLAQHAALACFTPASIAYYEARKAELKARRDYLVPALEALGFEIPVHPDGAFYIYMDCRRFGTDSSAFANALLEEAGVALVPGRDFGDNEPGRWLRLSYATAQPLLEEAVHRIGRFLQNGPPGAAQSRA